MNDVDVRKRIEHLPLGYYYMGEEFGCPECNEDMVFGIAEPNEAGGYSGEFTCVNCGHEWRKA